MKKHLLLSILLLSTLFLFACAKQDAENRSPVTVPEEDASESPSTESPSTESPSTESPSADISSDNASQDTADTGTENPGAYDSAADSINALGYDLFAKMASEDGNTCISPY